MKLLIMCMTFLMLLCGAAQAEAPDIAFETDFEEVYRQLVDAQWLDAQSEIVTTALDQPEQSLKHAADSGEHYAELILTEDGLPFQYAFCGDWEKPESLRLCIEHAFRATRRGSPRHSSARMKPARTAHSARRTRSRAEPPCAAMSALCSRATGSI